MEQELETIIIKGLANDESFCRKAIPHIKSEYFTNEHRSVYELILAFLIKYNKLPNSTVLDIEFAKSTTPVSDSIAVAKLIKDLDNYEKVNEDWLLESTEKWCKDRAVHIAIMESIAIIDGRSPTFSEGMIPDILSKALAVTFDTNVGHDYVESAQERFEYYHKTENKISFDIDIMNTITNGGIGRKSFNVLLAGPYCGKSLAMCHFSAAYLSQGYNVLYITMELAEEKIAERIDANLMDIQLDSMKDLSNDMFTSKINKIAAKSSGKLIIKEYPTGSAHAGHFRALLQELKQKKKFIPDVICIDYLNICNSSRIKGLSGGVNTYSLVKSIGEELRGLAVESNTAIWSATQVNRAGFQSSDVDMADTSESFGIPAIADSMFALIRTDQLDAMNQLLIKQLKNRYKDIDQHKRFTLGIDRSKMRLYDIEDPMANISTEPTTSSNVVQTPFSAGQPERRKIGEGFQV